jgi:DNA-binding FadR family transcriptional regulator
MRGHCWIDRTAGSINQRQMSKDLNRLYSRVAEDLTEKIGSGHFAVGERLPSERLLAREYQVSRPTIREALFALEIDGLIDVRIGSGVYVKAALPSDSLATASEMGPFEILEARRLIEGEACALAARRISGAELIVLANLLEEIGAENSADVERAEVADREFHEMIARSTQNSAMVNAVEQLWDARMRSREYALMSKKAHAAGIVPQVNEHRAIYTALANRDEEAARSAMHKHLERVLDSIMLATEVHELELAKERVEAQRRKFIATV